MNKNKKDMIKDLKTLKSEIRELDSSDNICDITNKTIQLSKKLNRIVDDYLYNKSMKNNRYIG